MPSPAPFPPLLTSSPLSPASLSTLSDLHLITLYSSLVILLWDWACRFSVERRVLWTRSAWVSLSRGRGRVGRVVGRPKWAPGSRTMRIAFLASRYIAILQAVLTVTLLTFARHHSSACNASRFLPYGFTLTSLIVHLVMALRIHRLFNRSTRLLGALGVWALVDLGLQSFGNLFVQPSFLPLLPVDELSSPGPQPHLCLLLPSSPLFTLTFLSPTLYHHTILFLTLYASWRHAQVEEILGRSVMSLLRREQGGWTLSICLINFLNLLLVLQKAEPGYRLLNLLPSLSLTQIFLGRIYFNLHAFLEGPKPPVEEGEGEFELQLQQLDGAGGRRGSLRGD